VFCMKRLSFGLMAILIASSVVSATASAELNGPWWKQLKKGVQIKLERNKELEVKGENEGAGTLKATLLNLPTVIKCNKVVSKGFIWNGLHQGEAESSADLTECEMTEPCKGSVTVSETKGYGELMWKYQGNKEELSKVGQQKIYIVGAPTSEPKEGKATITTFIGPKGTLCSGTFNVNAVGTPATFVDQHEVKHNIQWGTAALVEPQNEDVVTGRLNSIDPNIIKLHHQETPIEAKFEFAGNPAELQGKMKVEANSGEALGAFNG
jgi:hypothetical protein